jgi:hypothetical protein
LHHRPRVHVQDRKSEEVVLINLNREGEANEYKYNSDFIAAAPALSFLVGRCSRNWNFKGFRSFLFSLHPIFVGHWIYDDSTAINPLLCGIAAGRWFLFSNISILKAGTIGYCRFVAFCNVSEYTHIVFTSFLLLQKIIGGSGTLVPVIVSWCRVELWKFAVIVDSVFRRLIHGIIDFHDCGLISASVTIVRGRENRHHLPVVLPLIPFHDKLVCAWNKMKSVNVSKLLGNVLSKGIPGSPRWDAPSTSFVSHQEKKKIQQIERMPYFPRKDTTNITKTKC